MAPDFLVTVGAVAFSVGDESSIHSLGFFDTGDKELGVKTFVEASLNGIGRTSRIIGQSLFHDLLPSFLRTWVGFLSLHWQFESFTLLATHTSATTDNLKIN